MKINLSLKQIQKTVVLGFLLVLTRSSMPLLAQETNQMSNQDIAGHWSELDNSSEVKRLFLIQSHLRDMQQIQKILLSELDSKDDDLKFFAVYLLGKYRFSEAADKLASMITLQDINPQKSEKLWRGFPAEDALISIGNPSIPAVIRNLAESDDIKVRKLSLRVIYYIDNDKDIVQLRLQKALKAETNSQKQARLLSALNELDTPTKAPAVPKKN